MPRSTGLEASLFGLQVLVFWLRPHTVSPLYLRPPVSVHPMSSSWKAISQTTFIPTPKTWFLFNYPFQGPVSKYRHILRNSGLELPL